MYEKFDPTSPMYPLKDSSIHSIMDVTYDNEGYCKCKQEIFMHGKMLAELSNTSKLMTWKYVDKQNNIKYTLK